MRENIGEELTTDVIDEMLKKNDGITCVCFMGEGNDPDTLKYLISHLRKKLDKSIAIGLYTGADDVTDEFYWENLDYIKIGHYDSKRGPINNKNTNQRLYLGCSVCGNVAEVNGVKHFGWKDITDSFWK